MIHPLARCVIAVSWFAVGLSLSCSSSSSASGERWRVLALDYGRSSSFRHSTLIQGGDKDRRVEMSWTAWLIRPRGSGARRILVDTGFSDPALAQEWHLVRHTPVPRLLESVGVSPKSVTDVVLTHAHWDHMGDLSPYVNARVWMQRSAFDWASGLVDESKPQRQGVRLVDVQQLQVHKRAGKLELLEGQREIAPGVVAVGGGGHTTGQQWIRVDVNDAGTSGLILASDIAYLYEGIERMVPSGSTQNAQADVAQLRQMRSLVQDWTRIIPGHDPSVARRFPKVQEHVYQLK